MRPKKKSAKRRIFLLSPANLAGRRAEILLQEAAKFDLATRVRADGAPIGEIFSFISGLYFRGKLAYANAFSDAATARHSVFIITATRGLVAPHTPIGLDCLVEMAGVPISCSDPRYRAPLDRDLAKLARRLGTSAEIILLGSIATSKYLEPLSRIFGKKLLIPIDFVGAGDMSRGAMMLRAVRSMTPLAYAPIASFQGAKKR
ncbi:MAG TPA: hypothetical protein VJS43_17335 [Candidatus Acidoferrales bacterium]|nr:hypothetical protein [Candidatus Acidoferrales bacterium]